MAIGKALIGTDRADAFITIKKQYQDEEELACV